MSVINHSIDKFANGFNLIQLFKEIITNLNIKYIGRNDSHVIFRFDSELTQEEIDLLHSLINSHNPIIIQKPIKYFEHIYNDELTSSTNYEFIIHEISILKLDKGNYKLFLSLNITNLGKIEGSSLYVNLENTGQIFEYDSMHKSGKYDIFSSFTQLNNYFGNENLRILVSSVDKLTKIKIECYTCQNYNIKIIIFKKIRI